MCSGKTTLGKALAARVGLDFLDLDQFIEERQRMSVSDIFTTYGEARFRQLERDALVELAGRHDVVVACGGGTPCFFDNIDVMKRSGLTVWLRPSLETLARRLRQGRSTRPLIAAMADDEISRFAEESMAVREPFYSRADAIFCSDLLESSGQIDRSVELFINKFIK